MYHSLDHVIMKHPREAFRHQQLLGESWQPLFYEAEPNFEKALIEFEEFESILKRHVATIEYLPVDEAVTIDSIYAHDPVKFTPHGAIILYSGKASRQQEADAYAAFLEKQQMPILGRLTGDATCDGGDIVWLNEETVAIGRGYRTNDEAIRQLSDLLTPYVKDIQVIQLPHDAGEDYCLHLMSFLSIVDKDLAVVHSRLMPVMLRQWLLQQGFTLIEVPQVEYETLGCNVLALAPRVVVIAAGNPQTEQALTAAGATVYTYKGDEISLKGTGGPTCLTSPVKRSGGN